MSQYYRTLIKTQAAPPPTVAFILRIDTTLGDGLNQMRLPIRGTNMNIKWGDGSSQVATQTNQPVSTNWITHTYASAGIYDIEMTNVNWIRFGYEGDYLKALPVVQWGEYEWLSFSQAFYGCVNSGFPNSPIPKFGSGFIQFASAFQGMKLGAIPFGFTQNVSLIGSIHSIYNGNNLTDLTADSVVSLENGGNPIGVFGNNNLANVAPNLFDNFTNTDFRFYFFNNQLTEQSVDNILSSINQGRINGNLTSGTRQLDINGGTSATPSQIGKDAADALRGAGWVVRLNGY